MAVKKGSSQCTHSCSFNGFAFLLALLTVLQVFCHPLARAQELVKFLPGFQGPLPFELETGYVGVGESDEVQLYYYFIKSESNPQKDPLILWLTGGPGCSGFSGLTMEVGPMAFKIEEYTGNIPNLVLRSEAWTKISSIIFIDSPVGTGFSYCNTHPLSALLSDTKQVHHLYQFVRKWLMNVHPEFLSNPFYVGGESYSGIPLPLVTQEISDANERGVLPAINLQGYFLGNPVTDGKEYNYRVPFAHGMALISDELYKSLRKNCKGQYQITDTTNLRCSRDLKTYKELLSHITPNQVLDANCQVTSPRPRGPSEVSSGTCIREDLETVLTGPRLLLPAQTCRTYPYFLSVYWANNINVRKALHVREGSVPIGEWIRCNYSIPYVYEVTSTVAYHANLSRKGYRSLIFSGDHDSIVPYLATQAWIRSLNYSIVDDWRPWFVDGQVAGYTRTYSNRMTLATVKGGGHTPPEYKPKQCFAMMRSWLSGNPL